MEGKKALVSGSSQHWVCRWCLNSSLIPLVWVDEFSIGTQHEVEETNWDLKAAWPRVSIFIMSYQTSTAVSMVQLELLPLEVLQIMSRFLPLRDRFSLYRCSCRLRDTTSCGLCLGGHQSVRVAIRWAGGQDYWIIFMDYVLGSIYVFKRQLGR